ncbi:LOW QUALITY PROTEIN: uncharacterized protein [Amphiura filiformis]|uniref:LOW QUALITY PROTEIN: uncharacterized protein n=1 Tax=Amphiura filiformis TaxID=82378 RepID=UPI003B22772D
MDTEETSQHASDGADENRGTETGSNTSTKYVNGEVDNMPQQQCILTTLAPLDMALDTASNTEGQATESKEKLPNAKQKRDSHNEIERRRKCKINIGIIKLGEIIPSCINAKLSKNQILEHAANHIVDLTEKCEKLLTSSASETQAEEIKHLMKENERLRGENKRFQELMKTLQIPPNGVANPAAYLKSKGKKTEKLIAISKSNVSTSSVKPVVTTNTPRVLTTTQNMTILPSTNQIAGVNQVGTNQVVSQPGVGNAILVQNPNGGYFLVPTNNVNKNVTISVPNNQGPQAIAPNSITVVSSASGQLVNSSVVSNQATLGQSTMTTTSTGTATVTTQAVSTPIASATPQGAVVQAPGGMQTIRYLVPMNQNQSQAQTVMVMAKPNNPTVPIRIAPQVILPQPAAIQTSTSSGVEKSDNKRNHPSKNQESVLFRCRFGAGNLGRNYNPVTVGPNQVVLQRPPIQTTSVAQGGVNQNMVTMQVVPPKPVPQQIVYIQQNGQLIPVVIQNPNAQGTPTVIQQPQLQQQQQSQPVGGTPNQTVMTIPINQGQGMINNRQVVVVTQASQLSSGVITSMSNTNTTTMARMAPLSVVTPQSSSSSSNTADDIFAKAAESIFSPNTLNDNSPTLNFNETTETSVASAASPPASSTASGGSLPPFPIAIQRADDNVASYLKSVRLGQSEAAKSPVDTDSHGKKQKKSKKKKKKKEKNKEKSKEKSKDKPKDKDKKKSKKDKNKDEDKSKEVVKTEDDNTIIKELDRGIANSIDALPDSTSGTAIITDTLLQEWIEKEAGLTNPDQDGDSRGETITNVTVNQDKKEEEEEEPMDENPVQNNPSAESAVPSNYSAEALLAGSNDTPQANSTPTVPTTTASNISTPTTSSGETNTTSNSQNPFGSFPSFSFGSDILSSSMSVSGLPTYIEDEQSDEAKTPSGNGGLTSLKALGTMRDSILSFGGSQQTSTTQASTSQTQSDQDNSNQQSKDDISDRSRSVSPVQSLPMDSPPAPAPERDASSPESTHGFSTSPEPPNLLGSGSNLLSDNLEPKDSTPGQEEEESEEPEYAPQQNEPLSLFPASHNSSWISHHSRASHLASGLKKQKPPVAPPTSLPIPIPVTTSSTTTTTASDNPANIPPGFYTLPWLGPPITSTSSSSRMTPTSQVTSNLENSSLPVPEKFSIPRPTYLPTQQNPSPSYVPNQHSSTAPSYAPTQRSSSPTYVPPHRSSPPSYFPKISTQSLSTSSPLTVDTSVAHPIFSSSSQLIRRQVKCHNYCSSTNICFHNKFKCKVKIRPPLTKTKFSPSTIHRTLTSGITEEESPEKTEEPKAEAKPTKEQQREWQHKMPMQIKPGPEIRSKDGLLGSSNPSAQPAAAPLAKSKNKRSRKKKMALAAAAAAAKDASKEPVDGDKSHLEDIGKRELPKNLVDQFPWLADSENEKKAMQNKAQGERLTSFSIKSITQQISSAKASEPLLQKAITTPSSSSLPSRSPMTASTTTPESKVTSSYSQSQGSSAATPFWNPSTTGTYPRSTEATTLMSSSKPAPAVSVPSMPPSKSRIEYMPPRQSPNSFNPSLASSTNTGLSHNQSPVPLPNYRGTGGERQMPSPVGLTTSPQATDNQQGTDSRGRKPQLPRKQSSFNQKHAHHSETSPSPLSSPPDSSSSPLFSDFQLGGIPSNLLPNSGMDSRTTPGGMNHKQDSSPRLQMSNPNSPLRKRPPSRSSALPTPPSDNFLFSPTGSSSSTANQSSVFPNPGTNRSDNNQSEADDFMTLAQAEKSLDFLPSSSPDQSQNVDAIDLTALPMFDTPAGTPASTPSSIQGNVQSSAQSQRQQHQQQQQQISGRTSVDQQQQISGRTSVDRQQQQQQQQIGGRTSADRQQQQQQQISGRTSVDRQQQISGRTSVDRQQQISGRTLVDRQQQQQQQMSDRTSERQQQQQMSDRTLLDRQQQQVSDRASLERQQQQQISDRTSLDRQQQQVSDRTSLDRQQQQQISDRTSLDRQQQQQMSDRTLLDRQQQQQISDRTSLDRQQQQQMSDRTLLDRQQQQVSDRTSLERQQQQQQRITDRTSLDRQQQQQQIGGRTSGDRQPHYGQSQSINMRPNHPSHLMFQLPNAAQRQAIVTSSHSMTSNTASQNRFMPSPEMHHANQGTKRPASDSNHPQPSPKRTASGGGLQHPGQLSMPLMQGHETNRGMVLERAPSQTPHIYRVDHGMHRGPTPPSAVAQQQVGSPHSGLQHNQVGSPHSGLHHNQVGSPHSGLQHNQVGSPHSGLHHNQVSSPHSGLQHNPRSVEQQPSSGPAEISRVPTYDLSQRVGAQRNRPPDMVASSRQEATRVPTYDLTQSVPPQRIRSVERQAVSETRTPTYDLSQSAGAQRTRSTEHRPSVSEQQRIPTYDLTQSAGTQRNRSVERPTSRSEVHRTPIYDLTQSAGRNPVERHQQSRSETQKAPIYDLSQSAGAQRTRSAERTSSASETQRIPTYDLTQSPHREPVQPPKQQRKRPQNNTEQYFPASDSTSSLRHMDSHGIAQESNWTGFPSQRMPSVSSAEPSLSSPPFLPNFSSQSLPSSMSQSESVNTSSASIVPSISPSRRIRSDMPTYLPHPHLAPILSSPPQSSKNSIGREAEISTPFNPMCPPAHARAGLGMNVTPNFPSVFHEHPHQHAPPPFNVAKAQLPGGVGMHGFNFNIFNDVAGPNTSHSDTPGLQVHSMHHLHGNHGGMSVEDSMAHMRSNVPGRHVHGHPQAFGNNMRIDSLLGQNVSADGRTFKVGVTPMGAPVHSFGPGMPF